MKTLIPKNTASFRFSKTKLFFQSIKSNISISIRKTIAASKKFGRAAPSATTYGRSILIATSIIMLGTSIYPIKPSQAQSTEINDQFREGIYKGCLKTKGNSKVLCSCYSTKISRRYSPTQIIPIYQLIKSSDDARKMFFLSHSPDYAACKQRTH
jgi:hypothetical protein